MDYYRELLGPEFESYINALESGEIRRSLRVNTLKISKKELKKWLVSQGYQVEDSPFSSDGIDISGSGAPLTLKLPYISGFTYPQDSASMFAVEILDPQPGEIVLDLTAAPGGKSTQIAQRMKNTGVLIANDMDTSRLKALHSNLERLGVWNCVVTRMMPHKMAEIYPETFDRILLDPSCSGEGLLMKGGKPSFWSPKALKHYASEQFGMLSSAYKMLKPCGRIVFSTCTLNLVENDGVVKRLLEKFPEAEVQKIHSPFPPRQLGDYMGWRFWPQITRTKGFFCVAIGKKKSVAGNISDYKFEFVEESKFRPYDLDCAFVEKDRNLFCVSREILKFPLPRGYSLSFPIQINERLTYEGSLIPHIGRTELELTRNEVEKFVAREAMKNRGIVDGTYIAKFGIFPLGIAKIHGERMEINFPRRY